MDVTNNLGNFFSGLSAVDLTGQNNMEPKPTPPMLERPKSVAAPTQQQITAALIQQQNRVIAQQNIEKLNANLEKQRQHMQLQQQMDLAKNQQQQQQKQQQHQQQHQQQQHQQQQHQQQQHQQQQHFELPIMEHKLTDFLRSNLDNLDGNQYAFKISYYYDILFIFFNSKLSIRLQTTLVSLERGVQVNCNFYMI